MATITYDRSSIDDTDHNVGWIPKVLLELRSTPSDVEPGPYEVVVGLNLSHYENKKGGSTLSSFPAVVVGEKTDSSDMVGPNITISPDQLAQYEATLYPVEEDVRRRMQKEHDPNDGDGIWYPPRLILALSSSEEVPLE